MKLLLIAGARPNFMKIAPIVRELDKRNNPDLEYKIVHTGQHYDFEMSQAFFDDLECISFRLAQRKEIIKNNSATSVSSVRNY